MTEQDLYKLFVAAAYDNSALPGVKDMLSGSQAVYDEGRKDGYQAGFDDGRRKGFDDGYSTGEFTARRRVDWLLSDEAAASLRDDIANRSPIGAMDAALILHVLHKRITEVK